MSAGMVKEQSFEGKQMGCITGFLQIFDRHYSANRLPPSPVFDTTTSESEKSTPSSPAISIEFAKPSPILEGTKCSWKFGKEAPRLSLDSRATTDAKGTLHPKEIRTPADANDSEQHRSPSVIARLMGLDSSCFEQELRRSASESRVSRDLFHSRLTNFPSTADDNSPRFSDPINYLLKNASKVDTPKPFNRGAPRLCKSFFDSGDFFPETKQAVSIQAETENRLKLRGIEESSTDLETLKQILEALQLKGLLHSRKRSELHQIRNRNFVYDDSPIVVMKPSRSPNSTPFSQKISYDYFPPLGRNHTRGGGMRIGENSPRRDPNPAQTIRCPSPTTPNRTGGNAIGRRSNSVPKPKPLSVEMHSHETRQVSPNPKLNPRRTGRKAPTSTGSQRNGDRRERKAEDESWSISGGSERCKSEGLSLLERRDKLLHSIAEMTATEMQSSPVSVLDSSLYKDKSSTPSPITTRRNINFKDECVGLDEEEWSSEIVASQDYDFMYVSDVVRASRYLTQESDCFLLLEKQQYLKGKDTGKVSRLQRKLIFDTVHEILDRNKRLPPWKVASSDQYWPSLEKVWSEFQRVRGRESDTAQDLFGIICGVLKKDLAGDGISGWEDCPLEMSEAILDIERLIFKDLIGEAI
ncbi:hypothetical protein SASPL_135232 [Salvia splendens]|uniref:DUF4378 domain-containing protein n=1 Tax=Salvia splendens TaxID=180675 RepID=A0A8X8ZF94_SALSN|nr:protein LONGIFOLIA 1-like [Salvia splendens]KAG6403017.1 hypothetical protein SASPL_135232 [Salvia splendens]